MRRFREPVPDTGVEETDAGTEWEETSHVARRGPGIVGVSL